jgi:cytoskeleton protein RodZ
MTEGNNRVALDLSEPASAGAMLRKARQARGLHIAALATSIKVPPRKLELLEADRYDELLDLTFTRALAQTMCRALKIDPVPVLALLPKVSAEGLDHVESGLNEPFMDRPVRASRLGRSGRFESKSWRPALDLRWLLPGLLVLGSLVLYVFPGDWRLTWPVSTSSGPAVAVVAPQARASEPPLVVDAPTASVELLPPIADAASAVLVMAPADAAASAALSTVSLLELRVTQSSWVEVQDAKYKPLLARLVQTGEVVTLDGALPLRLKVGNASNTTVRFRGQPVDLTASTRDNVARIELK